MRVRPTRVEARGRYRLWLRYSDGVEGEVDVSRFAGKGIFKVWTQDANFGKVHISQHGSIAWPDDVELCPDSLYLQLTQKQPEALFEAPPPTTVHA